MARRCEEAVEDAMKLPLKREVPADRKRGHGVPPPGRGRTGGSSPPGVMEESHADVDFNGALNLKEGYRFPGLF
jgi:hypothetical protein